VFCLFVASFRCCVCFFAFVFVFLFTQKRNSEAYKHMQHEHKQRKQHISTLLDFTALRMPYIHHTYIRAFAVWRVYADGWNLARKSCRWDT
jgi:hypothetical protein